MHGLGHRASLSFDTHTHTHQMPGQKYKGVWRSIGKEGVFDFTEYEDVGLSEQVEEHGFDHEAFGEKAFERKKEALHTATQAQTRARDASAVKGSEASIESMMALVQQLQIGSSSSSASKDKPSATTDARSTSPVKADDGDSTSSDSSSEKAQAGPSARKARKDTYAAYAQDVGKGCAVQRKRCAFGCGCGSFKRSRKKLCHRHSSARWACKSHTEPRQQVSGLDPQTVQIGF